MEKLNGRKQTQFTTNF